MTEGSCFHCGQALPATEVFETEIKGSLRRFCCFGCQSVCDAIYGSGLQGFYQRTQDDTQLAPPPEAPKELALYDLDEVQSEFTDVSTPQRSISLLVEGIHCAACVWLIEHTLQAMPGVNEALVNLTGKRLKLSWDNSTINLSQLIQRLSEVGYAAVPYDPEVAEGSLLKQNRSMLFRLTFAGFTMMNMLWISISLYAGADEGEFQELFYWLGFGLATPTLFYSGYPFFKGALQGLRRLHLTMDLPIAIGATTTYLYSCYVVIAKPEVGEVYFDTVVNFLFVILIGRFLENVSKRRAVNSTQRLIELQPRGGTVLIDGAEKIMPIRAIKAGNTVLIKAGERVPVDGSVIEGHSSIDEAMLTGESIPVHKVAGKTVSAGTVNLDSALTVTVEGTLQDTALGRIIHLVEDAQSSKAPIQRLADRIVPWFVAATLLFAAITFSLWFDENFEMALMAATAVLIITCPCAFGLATPMSIAVASGQGAQNGILVKNGVVLETLSNITHFVFDKTGTLTQGKMAVHEILSHACDEQTLLLQAAVVEQYSEHSIARAIVEKAKDEGLDIVDCKLENFQSVAGYGVRGDVDGADVILGTAAWLKQNKVTDIQHLIDKATELEAQGISCVHVAVSGKACGLIAMADTIRPDAKALIENLRKTGMKLTLLSGDRKRVAEAVAGQLGGMDVIAEVLPEDKDRVVAELQAKGELVAMVGDGVNDAPALIRADVGIALGSGTDVSMDSADIVLISNELDKVRMASLLSRRTLRTIRQNIGISLGYNAITVPLAMMAIVTPLFAAIAMPISSLLVIGNAARIRTLFLKKPN